MDMSSVMRLLHDRRFVVRACQLCRVCVLRPTITTISRSDPWVQDRKLLTPSETERSCVRIERLRQIQFGNGIAARAGVPR
jgi:hypothetical protein